MTPAKGFAEMKDSGIKWIGEIPRHWTVGKVKNIFSATKTIVGNDVDSYQRLALTLNGVVKRSKTDDTGLQPEKFETYQILRPNELVFKLIDLQNVSTSRVGRSSYEGIVSPAYIVLHERSDHSTKYAEYFFLAMWMHQIFNQLGADGVRSNIGTSALLNLPFIIVPDDEQSAIASYLDTQCAKIDEIIDHAKASIEDYKQWKASIVDECISQALISSPQVRLKFLMTDIVDCPHETPEYCLDDNYLVIRTADQDFGFLRPDDFMYRLNEVEFQRRSRRLSLEKNDIVYGREGERWGLACLVPESGKYCLGQRIMQFRCRVDRILPQYAMWALNSRHVYLQGIVDTLGSTSPHVNIPTIRNYYIPIPPIPEQRRISTYLFEKCGSINTIIKAKQSLIDDLEAYKRSLIYEVVTGKRRVKDTSEVTIAVLSPKILWYRKALIMLRVLDLLGNDTRGRIQLQKCMFAAECLLNIAFHTQFIRYEHGPYDPELLNIEEILNKKGWYTVLNGSPVTYQKGKQFEEGLREYMDTFSDIDVKLRKIVGFLKPMKTSQAERVATLLAAWNDFIIDGVPHPTDKEIINEVVTHWTPNKANPQYSTWQDTLYKMRENQFVPKGTGVHTQQKKSQQEG
ncbi:restriction endonuclease subunit S [Intestinimonas butyriciproducens]|mgnify:FL=1|jgi:type I restriction enzyme S subunit|uniref:restriction endonuclease subunit S n=1 Tax=Intestinimonas butyriciproducens TaxID=1297617 RepID=UPI0034A2C9DF